MIEHRIDGRSATVKDLSYFVLSNYGAFTSFIVEDGGVRGLDFHLARLEKEAEALFGQAVPEAVLRQRMSEALGDRSGTFSLRVNLFSPQISLRQPDGVVEPKVLTSLAPAPKPLDQAARVQTQIYCRELPHLKHNATLGLTLARRRALEDGYDDALFIDDDGQILEGSVWTLGLVSGDTVVWPDGPQLAGTGQMLLECGLAGQQIASLHQPVYLKDLGRFDMAFLCNASTPVCPIISIDAHIFSQCNHTLERLKSAYASIPLQMI